jgi:thiol-disulfide isomerase/thioredoxin
LKTETTPSAPKKGSTSWRHWAINLLLILALFVVVQVWRAQPLAKGPAPALAGTLLDGDRVDLTNLRGEPVLVHFWATWCPICRMGDQDINALSEEFRVISVAMQSGGRRQVAEYMSNEGLDFPVILDEYGKLATIWGVRAVPASFVVDPKGQIRFATMGYTTEIGLRGRLWAARQ